TAWKISITPSMLCATDIKPASNADGVYLAPSAFEAGFMSVAHSMEDINNTIDAVRHGHKARFKR
ncbi:hypothetical protein PS003_24260, partial [Shigella sonnei]|nr:hypothetical protein [Shigella sonnei]